MLNGQCIVSLLVDASGEPQDAKIVHCSDAVFGSSSLMAVEKYRFQPARNDSGEPIAVRVSVEIDFHLADIAALPTHSGSGSQFRYGVDPPPETSSGAHLAKGVYLLASTMDPPKVLNFPDDTFTGEALRFGHGVRCEVVLTIDKKGIASDRGSAHCNESSMVEPAVNSLLDSKFSPARLNGRAISARVLISLAYIGTVPQP